MGEGLNWQTIENTLSCNCFGVYNNLICNSKKGHNKTNKPGTREKALSEDTDTELIFAQLKPEDAKLKVWKYGFIEKDKFE